MSNSTNVVPTSGMNCPVCAREGRKGIMIPMSKGNGLRCGTPGNIWNAKNRCWTICGNSIFLKNIQASERVAIPRPDKFPTIATPTDEQHPIRTWFGTSHAVKGQRLLIVNAGPGCGKTSTVSWSTEALQQRLGNLREFALVAFNRNARDVLLSRLPQTVSDIFTMNGLGMRIQGYRGNQIDASKLNKFFREQVKSLPKEDRPSFSGIDNVIDKMRAWGFYCDTSKAATWEATIRAMAERYAMLSRDKKPEDTLKTWFHYVPGLTRQALSHRDVIDFAEQWSRPVIECLAKNNIVLPDRFIGLDYEFTDDDIRIIANVVKLIGVNTLKGIVIDEAQDLSLCQIMLYTAMVWRGGEMVIIGDDRHGSPGDADYKAGQGIYGWRGAFGGSMKLIGRLWKELTGETAAEMPLSITHRCSPEVVDAIRPLNAVLKSTRPYGNGFAYKTSPDMAFTLWCNMPETNDKGKRNTAFWIVRTNKAAGEAFITTLKARVPVCFRGGDGFDNKVNYVFSMIGGTPDSSGEYSVDAETARTKLQEHINEQSGGNASAAADMIETFILTVMDEAISDPTIFTQVEGLPATFTLGNLKRFLLAFAAKDAARCVTNVYRCKGDEASWVFVGDVDQFNAAWNGDANEAAACRHVACSRAIDGLIVAGPLAGVVCPDYTPGSVAQSEAKQTVAQRGNIQLLAKVELTRVSASKYTYTHYNILKVMNQWYVYDGSNPTPVYKTSKLTEVRDYFGRM